MAGCCPVADSENSSRPRNDFQRDGIHPPTNKDLTVKRLSHPLIVSSMLLASVPGLWAAPFSFNDGDLIIGFQALTGLGVNKNVFFNAGPGTAIRDNPSLGTLGDIGATLSATYGSNWYNRTDLYFGVIGNLNGGEPTGAFGVPPVNGDPSRTFYLSQAASFPRTGTLIAAGSYPSAALGSAATKLGGLEAILPLIEAEADGAAVLVQGNSPVEWNNSWTIWNPTPGAAFDVFTGGIQQNFGKANLKTHVDIQRVVASNTGAIPTGVVGGGTYETTISISNTGKITAGLPFGNGELIVGFQALSGVGANKNVFFNLGSGPAIRDNPAAGNTGNIGATLTATYGPDWYTRSDLYFGVIGNLSASEPSGAFGVPPVDGDPARTFYVSQPAPYYARAALIPGAAYPNAALGSAGTKLGGLEAILPPIIPQPDGTAVLDQTASPVEWNNSWTTWNPTPGAAFTVFTGGIQQSFGKTTEKTYVDLQRVVATNVGASPEGVVGGGTYETTVAISSDGTITTSGPPPFAFNNGDLIIGFQALAGVGANKNVFFNAGAGTALRDNPALGRLGNVAETLSKTFGDNWYTRSDLYFGVIGNLSAGEPTGPFAVAPVNGDPARTFYLSQPAIFPGSAGVIAAGTYPNAALGSAGTKLSGLEAVLPTIIADAERTAVLSQATSPVEWNNSWTTWNPTPGAAFDVFTGGIQQSFGKPAPRTHVDVQRVLATNTGAVPTGVVGGGTFESTISISSTGEVTAQAPSAYDQWLKGYPGINDAGKALTGADPDNDGAINLEEFGFGGDPTSGADTGFKSVATVDADNNSIADLTMTVQVREDAVFSASGGKLVSGPVDGIVYEIEGSVNLMDWTSAVSEVTPIPSGTPADGYTFKTIRLDAAEGLQGKGFLRAAVTKQ
jgi:hypothetical protein